MNKLSVRKWLLDNGYEEKEKCVFIRTSTSQICICKFLLGKKHLFYDVYIKSRWVFTECVDLRKLYINKNGALSGMEFGLFAAKINRGALASKGKINLK